MKTLTQGKSDSEHRRKKAESQLQELLVKHGESERQRAELGEKMTKIQVMVPSVSRWRSWKLRLGGVGLDGGGRHRGELGDRGATEETYCCNSF